MQSRISAFQTAYNELTQYLAAAIKDSDRFVKLNAMLANELRNNFVVFSICSLPVEIQCALSVLASAMANHVFNDDKPAPLPGLEQFEKTKVEILTERKN